jgi:hypothetical protein
MYNGFLTNLYNPITINSLVGVKGIGVPLPINTKLPEQKMYITTPRKIGANPKYRYIPMSKR